MKQRIIYAVLAPVCLVALSGPAFRAGNDRAMRLRAHLTGLQEVPPTLTSATGDFTAVIDASRTSMTFTLTYTDLSTPVLFAHIHFGPPLVNGGVMVFFCNNNPMTTPPPGTPPCPTPGGTVSGTRTDADVVAVGAQGIRAGNFNDVLAAIATGRTYVNVHSQRSPGGEIRGRVKVEGGDDQH